MKKALVSLSVAFLLVACGDTVENINQTGMEVVTSEEDLPKCGADNEGEIAFVKEDNTTRVCVNKEWFVSSSDGSATSDFSCKTVELEDGSGLKIVCNGDSIGVVLNGSDGKDGEKGKDGEDGKDGEVGSVWPDTTVNDSERTAVSLDSLAGFTQKGPYLKGSTVYLYELSDGRTLKQTNGNFTSKITSDDGHYKFTARDLVSQYAMVVVDGFYRNEVTGKKSDAALRLSALTDMHKRSSVNVNLLTHMEFDRVYNLVTRGDSTGKKLTVKKAKRQAQKEILSQFHIDLGDTTDAEDMDVFGKSDADAALLAVSVLLQGDSGTTDLSVLLTEISNDIAEFGEWKNKAGKAKLADWALKADAAGRLANFSKNVTGWGLGVAPDFAKFVRNYVGIEDGLGVCGSEDVPVNTAVHIKNPKSFYYSTTYTAAAESDSKERFICKTDTNGVLRWHIATDLEKDTLGWGHDYKDGDVKRGQVNNDKWWTYVYDAGKWRAGFPLDDSLGLGCTYARRDTVMRGNDKKWYTCAHYSYTLNDAVHQWTEEGYSWRESYDIEKDTVGWGHDYEEGKVRNGNVNSNLVYVYEDNNWREGKEIDSLLGLGCVEKFNDTLVSLDYKDKVIWYFCAFTQYHEWKETKDPEYIESSFWEQVGRQEKDTQGRIIYGPLALSAGRPETAKVWDGDTLRNVRTDEIELGRGCVSYIDGANDTLGLTHSSYTCKYNDYGVRTWVFDSVNVITDLRDSQTYRTIKIGDLYWMAENLNYAYLKPTADLDSSSWCYNNDPANCETYGRLYQWSAAIDSTTLDSLGYTCGNNDQSCGIEDFYFSMQAHGTGICPTGWYLPSRHDFEVLLNTAESTGDAGANLKSVTGWANTGNGFDTFGFSALPAGRRNYGSDSDLYSSIGIYTNFWSYSEPGAGEDGQGSVYTLGLSYNEGDSELDLMAKHVALSVRCIKKL